MPTGYTAAIKDGITFQEYAFHCARAFGALILMRDEPQDTPIPDEFEPSDYHFEELKAETEELADLQGKSDEQLTELAEAKFRDETRYYEKSNKERQELLDKYNAMLEQAKAYVAPTPDHEGYAEFLVNQIEESIKWDCNPSYPDKPVLLTGAEYKAQRLEKLALGINYHTKNRDEEIERAAGRTAWVKALKQSLNPEPANL